MHAADGLHPRIVLALLVAAAVVLRIAFLLGEAPRPDGDRADAAGLAIFRPEAGLSRRGAAGVVAEKARVAAIVLAVGIVALLPAAAGFAALLLLARDLAGGA